MLGRALLALRPSRVQSARGLSSGARRADEPPDGDDVEARIYERAFAQYLRKCYNNTMKEGRGGSTAELRG